MKGSSAGSLRNDLGAQQGSAIIQWTNPAHHSLPNILYLRVWFPVRVAGVAELVEEVFSLPQLVPRELMALR